MDLSLRQSPVIVTGASGGIGRAIAVALAREGARVAVTYHRGRDAAEETARLVAAAGGEALVAPFALEDPSTAPQLTSTVVNRWGGLHALVNNAVQWPNGFTDVEQLTLEDFQTCVSANVFGTFALIKAALPALRAAPWGRIVTLSTSLVIDGFPGSAAYMTGKTALHGLNRTLAKEVGPHGILTNVLMSGAVDTRPRPPAFLEQLKRSAVTGRLTSAEDVAAAAVFLASPANGHITGEAIRCDGFFTSGVRRES